MFIPYLPRLRRPSAVLLLGMLISCITRADEAFIIGVDTHLMNKPGTSVRRCSC